MQILQSSKYFTVLADMNDKGLLTSVLWSEILNKYLIVFWMGSDGIWNSSASLSSLQNTGFFEHPDNEMDKTVWIL